MHADVCVVGGGIAGLAAAGHLAAAGLSVRVLEGAEQPGGRARDARVDGFLIGDGAHLLHTTWPHLRQAISPARLQLGGFAAGIRICSDSRAGDVYPGSDSSGSAFSGTESAGTASPSTASSGSAFPGAVSSDAASSGTASPGSASFGSDSSRSTPPGSNFPLSPLPHGAPVEHLRRMRFGAAPTRPQQTFSALRMPIGTPADKARLSKLLYRLGTTTPDRSLAGPEHPASDSYAVRGYSAELVDQLLRPYLAALAGDEDLTLSVRGADWLLRLLVRGRFAVAGAGVAALVRELANRLPEAALQLGVRVHTVRADRVATSAGEIRARAIMVAADPCGAVALLPGLQEPRMRSVTTFWHTVPDALLPVESDRAPSVLVDAEPGSPVARTAAVSRAAPNLAPPGRALVATTVFGGDGKEPGALDRLVIERLARLYGVLVRDWQTIDIRHVEHGVVTMRSPYNFARPIRLIKGLYVCGDHRDLPNVEGALQSGLRAAKAVLADLGMF